MQDESFLSSHKSSRQDRRDKNLSAVTFANGTPDSHKKNQCLKHAIVLFDYDSLFKR